MRLTHAKTWPAATAWISCTSCVEATSGSKVRFSCNNTRAIVDFFPSANGADTYHDACWCSGNIKTASGKYPPEIWVGIYDDNDWRTASFFQILGSIWIDYARYFAPDQPVTECEMALADWEEGMAIAASEGYAPSESTFEKCMEAIGQKDKTTAIVMYKRKKNRTR
jgi:hypothetical protein